MDNDEIKKLLSSTEIHCKSFDYYHDGKMYNDDFVEKENTTLLSLLILKYNSNYNLTPDKITKLKEITDLLLNHTSNNYFNSVGDFDIIDEAEACLIFDDKDGTVTTQPMGYSPHPAIAFAIRKKQSSICDTSEKADAETKLAATQSLSYETKISKKCLTEAREESKRTTEERHHTQQQLQQELERQQEQTTIDATSK